MKSLLLAATLTAFSTDSSLAQQAYDDSAARKSSAERIERTYGLRFDWSKTSLTNLIDMEGRLGSVSRIKRSYGVSLDWRTESLSSLIDKEGRLGAVSRIKRTYGLMYDWQKNSLSSLIDAEARMGAAARLSKATGREVDWSKFSLTQLIEVEAKIIAQQNPGRVAVGAAPVPAGAQAIIETKMDGEFEGWDGETVFKLANGQIWQQSEYAYTYHYAYRPDVLIYPSKFGGWKMKVDGVERSIGVERLK